jgi:hypothetical protein
MCQLPYGIDPGLRAIPLARLMDLAKVIRSKNAGPYGITFDIMFDDPDLYDKVKRTGIINRELFAQLYHVDLQVVLFTTYDAAYAFKGQSPPRVGWLYRDTDEYGAQQHILLLTVEVSIAYGEA